MSDQTPPAQPDEPTPENEPLQPGPQAPQAPSFLPDQPHTTQADQQHTQPQEPQQPAVPQSNLYPPATQYPAAQGYPEQPQVPQQYPNQQHPNQQFPGQPGGYPGAAGYPGAVAPKPTNTLAVVSLILGIVFAPAGIITGHMALSKIKRTGEGGRGLAIAGTIIGYISVGLGLLSLIFVLLFTFIAGTAAMTAATSGSSQIEELEQFDQFDSFETPGSSTEEPDGHSSGALLDTPEKVLAEWDKCDLAMELNNPGNAFYDEAEWVASQEALARLMDPSPESDAIRAYSIHIMSHAPFDMKLTAAHVDATMAAEAKLCAQ